MADGIELAKMGVDTVTSVFNLGTTMVNAALMARKERIEERAGIGFNEFAARGEQEAGVAQSMALNVAMRADMPDEIADIFGDILKDAANGGGIRNLSRTLAIVKELTVEDVRTFKDIQVCAVGTQGRPWLILPGFHSLRTSISEDHWKILKDRANQDLIHRCEQLLLPARLVIPDTGLRLSPNGDTTGFLYKDEPIAFQGIDPEYIRGCQITDYQFSRSGVYLVGLLGEDVWMKKDNRFRQSLLDWLQSLAPKEAP